jgi:hypothetical protein
MTGKNEKIQKYFLDNKKRFLPLQSLKKNRASSFSSFGTGDSGIKNLKNVI